MSTKIYPMQLSESTARKLVSNHLRVPFEREMRARYGDVSLTYYATLQENGEVDVFVHYVSEGFGIQSAGPLIREKIRPYDAERIAELEEQRKFEIARAEYERRQSVKALAEIDKIKKKLFA
jgi:hypothetical protein